MILTEQSKCNITSGSIYIIYKRHEIRDIQTCFYFLLWGWWRGICYLLHASVKDVIRTKVYNFILQEAKLNNSARYNNKANRMFVCHSPAI